MKRLSLPNYNFDFDKNETKILTQFCKQVLKQTQGNEKLFQENKIYTSLLEKLSSGQDTVKLTKDEKFRLKTQLESSISYLKKTSAKSWFIKRWLYKSMITQYTLLLEKHFKG